MVGRGGGVAVLRCGIAEADASRARLSGLLAQHIREGHRERGSLGAWSWPSITRGERPRSKSGYTYGHRASSHPVAVNSFGVTGPCGWWLRRAPPPSPQRLSSGPASHRQSDQDLIPASRGSVARLLSLTPVRRYS